MIAPVPDSHCYLAVIGTAGRDKTKPMSKALWTAMCADLRNRVISTDTLVSGGAAWSDHLAVYAYLQGWCTGLVLHLPAPFNQGRFQGPPSSSATAANFYHDRFESLTGVAGLAEIRMALDSGAEHTCEPFSSGYGAMFARNAKVAQACSSVVAYTFGEGDIPAKGGTLDTWQKVAGGNKTHVSLQHLQLLQPY